MIASTLLQNGTVIAIISVISVMLGYQSMQTTERVYLSISKKQATRTAQALDALLKPKNNDESNNKLEKLRILLPEKIDELSFSLVKNMYNSINYLDMERCIVI
jgi:hypothetical protein